MSAQDKKYIKHKEWLARNTEKRNRYRRENYKRGQKNAENKGQSWTLAEIREIMNPNRPNDILISQKIGRSVHAIQCKRNKCKARSTYLNQDERNAE